MDLGFGGFVIIFHPLLFLREMSENSECRPQMLTNEIIRKGSSEAQQQRATSGRDACDVATTHAGTGGISGMKF